MPGKSLFYKKAWTSMDTRDYIRLYNTADIYLDYGKGKRVECNYTILIPKKAPRDFVIQYRDKISRKYAHKRILYPNNDLDAVLGLMVYEGLDISNKR